MNIFICSGKIARAGKFAEAKGDSTAIRFSVTTENGQINSKGNARKDYISCVVFNPDEELAGALTGAEPETRIEFQGKVTTSSTEGKEKKFYRTEIVVFPKSVKIL